MAKDGKKDDVKKLHVEIMPANWDRLEAYLHRYNDDPERITPRIKYAHVINQALHLYFRKKKMC
jgi:hypothetical protein